MPATEAHLRAQQDAERRAADQQRGGGAQLAVVHQELAGIGHQQQRLGRVVFEAHAPGAPDPGGALGRGAVLRDLQEAGAQRGQRVEIGLDAREVGAVALGRRQAGRGGRGGGALLRQGRGGQQQRREQQGASVHQPDVARAAAGGKGAQRAEGAPMPCGMPCGICMVW